MIWKINIFDSEKFFHQRFLDIDMICQRSQYMLVYLPSGNGLWKYLKNFFVKLLKDHNWSLLQRRLEDVLKTKNCYTEEVLKTPWRHVLKTCLEEVMKTCLEDVLKTCLKDVCKMSWRQIKCFLKLSVSNKSKCVSNKSCISQIYVWRI